MTTEKPFFKDVLVSPIKKLGVCPASHVSFRGRISQDANLEFEHVYIYIYPIKNFE